MDNIENDFIVEPSCNPVVPEISGVEVEIENELHHLICNRFGFDEQIYKRIIDHDFDIESLLVTTGSELSDLFPAPMLGTRAKFRFHLNLWRKNASTISVSNSCREWIEAQSSVASPESQPIASTSSFLGGENYVFTSTKLLALLNSSEIVREVLKYYDEHTILDEENKDIMTSLIVGTYTNDRKCMSTRDIVIATDAIHSIFPKECKEYYMNKRGHGLNPTGKLHDKAVNSNSRIRNLRKSRTGEQPDNFRAANKFPPSQEPIITESDSEVILWLQHNNESWSSVETKWTQVVAIRQHDMKRGEGQNILKKWPLFKHTLGHTLVDIDYNILYSNNLSQLFALWPSFVEKILPYFQKYIKDKNSLQLLKELEKNIDENSRDYILFLLIHAILKPPIVGIGKCGKKSKWKPSIIDSQESSIIYCISPSNYMTKVEELKLKYLEKGLTFQPVIIVIGEEKVKLQHFYVYYDGILYKFNSFLKCLDIIFKLFHIMNFEYPVEGKNVYNFIEHFFYNFKTDKNSNVTSVLEYLKSEISL